MSCEQGGAFGKSGNGSLDGREVEDLLKSMGVAVSRQELQELISVVDTDLSGAVEFGEFLEMQWKIASGQMKDFGAMLEVFLNNPVGLDPSLFADPRQHEEDATPKEAALRKQPRRSKPAAPTATDAELSEEERSFAASIVVPVYDPDFYDDVFVDFTLVPLLLRSGMPYMQANGFAEETKANSDGGRTVMSAMRGPEPLISALKLDLAVAGVALKPSVERSIIGDPFWAAATRGSTRGKAFVPDQTSSLSRALA